MDAIFNQFGNIRDSIDLSSLLRNSEITRPVQRHLVNVYAGLVVCLLAAVGGVVVDARINLGGGFLSMMGCMGTLMWINNSGDSEKVSTPMRMGQLSAFGFFQGASIAPLVNAVMYVDPAIVITALVGTATVFACFTAASLSAARRSYLYLGGLLSSALSLLFWLSFANWFFRFQWVHAVQLYGGLLMFIGYVIFDTQFILERAIGGDRNFAKHAANLFVDFVAIFVRLLIIIMRNSNSKRERDERDRRNRSRW